MKLLLVVLGAVLFCMACAHQETVPPMTSMNLEKTAMKFRDAGDHLNASYYFEAALDTQAQDDLPTLKLLIEEQVLAGRLLAARASLNQLEQLGDIDPSVRTLRQLVEQFIGLRVSEQPVKEGEL